MPFLNRKAEKKGYKTIAETPIMSGLTSERNQTFINYNPKYELHNTYSPENGGLVITGNFMIHDGPDNINVDQGWGAAGCIEVTGTAGFQDFKTFIHKLSGSNDGIEDTIVNMVKKGLLVLKLDKATKPNVIVK